ncbi:unnamed protein product [Cladocopium goreaui]|uniref:DEAD-box ATP-dependent RNA helicase 9 n=1 Tax=Cladocopium goreaui TaxID=2562237 RepID=A0A9P1D1L7_9DINO|nr:unnamed protein product [Cladocopium goreaui]
MAKAKQWCRTEISRLTRLIVFLPFLGLFRFSSQAFQAFTPRQIGCSLRRAPTRSARLAGRPSQLYKQHSEDFLATEGERIYSDVDAASVKVSREEDGYAFDESVFSDEDKPEDIGPVHYYGVTDAGGIPILITPGEAEMAEADRLYPGDVVAAQVPPNGTVARLLDGRGWLDLEQLGETFEEVQPWAAKIMKKPGITKADAASLGYLSLDDSKLTPLAQHLPLPNRVVSQLYKRGVKKASPIQEAVFSDIYRGKSLCLQSQTGTGKTLAMVLPLLTAMSEESQWGRDGDKIVVITSCRELAVQLFSDIDSMGFFPKGQGFATMVIVGNVPPSEAVLNANVIIGTPNELGGLLHKDNEIVRQMNTKLRGIILDEVDEYTTAPRLFASKWAIKKKRRIYNEKKAVLSGRLGDFNTGVIEWFLKRSLAYSRRRDLQVLAASATMNRDMARKVHRLLRWDPLGRWYQNPPPLMRPLAMMKAEWQAVPLMPTVPLDLKHRYIPVIPGRTDTRISEKHWMRKPYDQGGLPRLKVRGINQRRGMGQRPMSLPKANAILDSLHDALKSRQQGSGSSLVIICRSVGLTVREALQNLHGWGFHEAEAIHEALWTDPEDWPSRWAMKYTYDQQDHASEIAEKHQQLNQRTRNGQPLEYPVGSNEWRELEARKEQGESVAPVLIGFEGLGRGIHFDGVDTVYILGLPQKPKAYLHYAGRVGRLGQKAGKVVSIIPAAGENVLNGWSSKIGPGVQFREEKIQRILSSRVSREKSYRLPLETRRSLQKEETEADEKEPLLLPEPEDPFRLPSLDDEDEEDVFEDFEPEPVQIPEKVREAMRNRGSSGEVVVKKMAQEMQRATSRWPGPQAVPRYVSRKEIVKQEKAEKAKAKSKGKA